MTVVAGQVWTPKGDATPHVVTGLRFDFDSPPAKINAQLVKVSGDGVYSYVELDCDALRDAFDLVYDATLIEPYAVAA